MEHTQLYDWRTAALMAEFFCVRRVQFRRHVSSDCVSWHRFPVGVSFAAVTP
jgi:hypothetical protein